MSFLLRPASRATTITSSKRHIPSLLSQPTRRSFARMTVVGRIGTDPELSDVSTGKMIRYVVGSNVGSRDNQVTSWFRVSAFVRGEETKKLDYLMGIPKGTLVYVEGDASLRAYTDDDGKKQSALNIVQTKIEVLKRPASASGDGGQGASGV